MKTHITHSEFNDGRASSIKKYRKGRGTFSPNAEKVHSPFPDNKTGLPRRGKMAWDPGKLVIRKAPLLMSIPWLTDM